MGSVEKSVSSTSGTRESRSGVLSNTLIVLSGTMVSRLLGFIKLAITIYVLSKTVNDVFQFSRFLPSQLYEIFLASAFSAILIPSFVKTRDSKEREQFLTALFLIAVSALFVVMVVGMIGAPLFVTVFNSSVPDSWRPIVVALTICAMPQIFFLGLHSLLGQYLNSQGRFIGNAWAPVLNNLVVIVSLLIFNHYFNRHTAAGMMLNNPDNWSLKPLLMLGFMNALGVACQALILIWPAYRAGLRLVRPLCFRGLGLGETFRNASWAMVIVVITQIYTITSSNVASAAFAWTAKTGEVVPSYIDSEAASLFCALPFALFVMAASDVLFPKISKSILERDYESVVNVTLQYERYMAPIVVFCSLALIVCAVPLAQLVTYFSGYNPALVAIVIVGFAPIVIPNSLLVFRERILFANVQAKSVFLATIIPAFLYALLGYIVVHTLPAMYWVMGAGLAKVSVTILLCHLLHLFIPREQRASVFETIRIFLRPLLAAILIGSGFYYLSYFIPFRAQTILGVILRLLLVGSGLAILFLFLGVEQGIRKIFYRQIKVRLKRH